MSRKLDAAIVQELGCVVRWLDTSVRTYSGKEEGYGKAEPFAVAKDRLIPVHLYSTDGNSMLEIFKISCACGWNVQVSIIEDRVSVSIYAYGGEPIEGSDGEYIVVLIAEAEGKELPETFARAFYQARSGRKWLE